MQDEKENEPKNLNCLRQFHGYTKVSDIIFILRIEDWNAEKHTWVDRGIKGVTGGRTRGNILEHQF